MIDFFLSKMINDNHFVVSVVGYNSKEQNGVEHFLVLETLKERNARLEAFANAMHD